MNKWVESMNRAINILQEQIKEYKRGQRIQDQQITIDHLWVDRWGCMYFKPKLDTRFLKITNPHKDISIIVNARMWDPGEKTKKFTSVCLIEPESEVIYDLLGNPVIDGREIRFDFEKVDPSQDEPEENNPADWMHCPNCYCNCECRAGFIPHGRRCPLGKSGRIHTPREAVPIR